MSVQRLHINCHRFHLIGLVCWLRPTDAGARPLGGTGVDLCLLAYSSEARVELSCQ